MALPDRTTPSTNRLAPDSVAGAPRPRSLDKGDVPPALLDRYLVERDRQGRAERFFRDHRTREPMFHDRGRSLVAGQSYPDTVADMLKIARHRGWSAIRVTGDEGFRREVWVQAQALGLEVKGHRPTERDRAAASPPDRETSKSPSSGLSPSRERRGTSSHKLETRLAMATQVVRATVADPEMQARLIARAWARAAPHLERGFRFRAPPEPDRPIRSNTADRDGPDRSRKR